MSLNTLIIDSYNFLSGLFFTISVTNYKWRVYKVNLINFLCNFDFGHNDSYIIMAGHCFWKDLRLKKLPLAIPNN